MLPFEFRFSTKDYSRTVSIRKSLTMYFGNFIQGVRGSLPNVWVCREFPEQTFETRETGQVFHHFPISRAAKRENWPLTKKQQKTKQDGKRLSMKSMATEIFSHPRTLSV